MSIRNSLIFYIYQNELYTIMNKIKNLGYFLRDASIIRKKYEERERNADRFNLFYILRKESDEVYLHSRFISSLLDPQGPHKMGTLFLDIFIAQIESSFEYKDNTLEVYPNNQNRSEYKNIDILLMDKIRRKAVIIENKIYHSDTNHEDIGQIENYYSRLIEEDRIPASGIEVFYLTLDGHEPSPESIGTTGRYPDLKDKVICISYATEILDWLNKCVKESYNKPSLRESVNQYIKLIENMTNNNTSEEERREIINMIGSNDDNLDSAKMLFENFDHVKWYTLHDFWNELKIEFERQGYQIVSGVENEALDALVHHRRRKDLQLVIRSRQGLPIYIENYYEECISYGLFNDTKCKISDTYKKKIKAFIQKNHEFKQEGKYLCWAYFHLPDNENVQCSDFGREGTFRLISSRYRKQTIDRIVAEINDFHKQVDNTEIGKKPA